MADAPGTTTPPTTTTAPPATTTPPVTTTTPPATGTGATVTTWPNEWRNHIAGDDKDVAQRLERFATPSAIWQSFRSLEQRVSSGELKSTKPFPDKGSPEEQTAWRKENGIPEAHDKYDLEGIKVEDGEKPVLDAMLKEFHAANMSPAAVKQAIKTLYAADAKATEAKTAKLGELARAFEETMRKEWGQDYMANKNSIRALTDMAPNGFGKALFDAMLPDGTPLGSHPDFARFMVAMARDINPPTTLTGANMTPDAVSNEIADIEKQMGNPGSDYWKGPKADGSGETRMQVRYRQLVEARDRKKA